MMYQNNIFHIGQGIINQQFLTPKELHVYRKNGSEFY